jgi:hypothetical protein
VVERILLDLQKELAKILPLLGVSCLPQKREELKKKRMKRAGLVDIRKKKEPELTKEKRRSNG